MPRSLLRLLKDIHGNVALSFAIGSVVILGAVGVAADYGRETKIREELASILDDAVLAGAASDANHIAEATKYFDKNFNATLVKSVSRTFTKSGDVVISGTVNAEVETSFAKVLGFQTMAISVSSTAESATPKSIPCIMALSKTASQALLLNSGAKIDAVKCEVHDKSTANNAAIFNSGTTLNVARTCIEGSSILDNGGTHPNLEKSCATAADPYAGNIAEPPSATCDFNDATYSGSATLNPGVYCGWHNFNAGTNVTLKPGLYVIKNGGWNANGGNWTGNGVTIYYADNSKIQFNSGVSATLTAPTSGTYKGIVMAEKAGLPKSQFVLDDNQGFDMSGAVYLPSREFVINSGSTLRSHKTTLVADTIILNGVNWKLEPPVDAGAGGSSVKEVRLIK